MTLADATLASLCPACAAPLAVRSTRASGRYLQCTGAARHAFDLRPSLQRGTGRFDGVPVHRDQVSALDTRSDSERLDEQRAAQALHMQISGLAMDRMLGLSEE